MLRPSSASLTFSTFPRGGRLYQRKKLRFQTVCFNPLRNTLRGVTRRAMPAPEGEGYEIGRQISDRKQVAPLDLQKFLPKYSENQKWATHNMLRPSSVRFTDSFPPRGSLFQRQKLTFGRFNTGLLFFQLPLITAAMRQSFPRGGSLYLRQKLTFGR